MNDNNQVQPVLNNSTKKEYRKYFGLLILAVLVFSCIIFWSYYWTENRKIEKLVVIGNQLITEKEIIDLVSSLSIGNLRKDIDLNKIGKTVSKNPFVEKFIISFEGSDALKIEIIEKKPVAILCESNGKLSFIDEESIILPYQYFERIPDLVLVRNLNSHDSSNNNSLKHISNYLNMLQKDEFEFLSNKVSEIIFNQKEGTVNLILSPEPVLVKMGYNDELYNKFFKLQKFVLSSDFNETKNYDYIDIRWAEQVVVKGSQT